MSWPDRWHALSARIEGLIRAGEYVVAALARNDGDTFGIVRTQIAPEFQRITGELRKLMDEAGDTLPPAAQDALARFFVQDWFTFEPALINTNLVSIAALATLRSEFAYLIGDIEIDACNRSEVAFEHLQRLIAVNPQVRNDWNDAYNNYEPACERLGSVHLLSHEIFAFKANGIGAATDLLYNEPLDNTTAIIRQSARALIITEWKRVTDSDNIDKKAAEARKQTENYRRGVLGGTELRNTRYVVLVTTKQTSAPADITDNGVRFRHICIAVDPDTPSKDASKASL